MYISWKFKREELTWHIGSFGSGEKKQMLFDLNAATYMASNIEAFVLFHYKINTHQDMHQIIFTSKIFSKFMITKLDWCFLLCVFLLVGFMPWDLSPNFSASTPLYPQRRNGYGEVVCGLIRQF